MSRLLSGTALAVVALMLAHPAFAQNDQAELDALKSQMKQMQERIAQLETTQSEPSLAPAPAAPANANAFNPAISAVLNGHYGSFSAPDKNIPGFAIGDEGGRKDEGFALDESEINFTSNIDDKFTASLTASLEVEDGETTTEVEEAWIKTLGLPYGLSLKAGRFFVPVGYVNENHEHTDDFVDRALPNRAFLNNAYKDNGVQASVILPTDLYTEIGGFALQGNDFPGGGSSGSDPGAYGAYAKIGGDIGDNQNWLTGFSWLHSTPDDRGGNDGDVTFAGTDNLYAAFLRYIWNPTGNSQDGQLILQGEYFLRDENGTYDDSVAGTGPIDFDGNQNGWYTQAIYKFLPQWRVGARYSRLDADAAPLGLTGSELDIGGHDPWNATAMVDWSNSEFSRVRLQYGYEDLDGDQSDNQVLLQYIVSLGAHPAHKF